MHWKYIRASKFRQQQELWFHKLLKIDFSDIFQRNKNSDERFENIHKFVLDWADYKT